MSRMTCLIIFSGCSALSIKSFRLARISVETRSSNAIKSSKSTHDHCFFLATPNQATAGSSPASRSGIRSLPHPRLLPSAAACLCGAKEQSDRHPRSQPEDPTSRNHGCQSAHDHPQNHTCQRDFLHDVLLAQPHAFVARKLPVHNHPESSPQSSPPSARSELVLSSSRRNDAYLPAALFLPAAGLFSSPEGLGALSPIWRTLESRSLMLMPESDSNSAGTCAAICAMSPVILLAPADVPLPVDTMVILSTMDSGWAIARTRSGTLHITLSRTPAS